MSTKSTLIYIGDPLCSWCYGFGPELESVLHHFGDKVGFEMIMGGLRPGETEVMDQAMKRFLRSHWDHVKEASGLPFSYDILKEESQFVYDTEPPARAVVTVRQLKPEAELTFFLGVQRLFYAKGADTNMVESYFPLLEELSIESGEFSSSFESEEMKRATSNDFQKSRNLGVSGFPALLITAGDRIFALAKGYAKAPNLIQMIDHVLREEVNQ